MAELFPIKWTNGSGDGARETHGAIHNIYIYIIIYIGIASDIIRLIQCHFWEYV